MKRNKGVLKLPSTELDIDAETITIQGNYNIENKLPCEDFELELKLLKLLNWNLKIRKKIAKYIWKEVS